MRAIASRRRRTRDVEALGAGAPVLAASLTSGLARRVAPIVLAIALFGVAPLEAQDPRDDIDDTRALLLELRQELRELREQVDARLEDIESRMTRLETGDDAAETSEELQDLNELLAEAGEALAPTPQETPASPPTPAAQTLNPQLSVIGDFLGAASWEVPEPFTSPAFDLREVEIAFQSRIDPFARADFYVSVPSLEEVGLEEGFVTFLTMPADLLVRLGKVRVPFGRANVDHRPEAFTVDRPDVIEAYFGEDGLAEMGATVSRLIPNPWDAFMEIEVDILQGVNETSFGGGSLSDLLYNIRLSSFFDLSPRDNLSLGVSYVDGVNDVIADDRFRTDVFGIDVTYQWRPLRLGAYRSFIWQTELLRGRRDTPSGLVDTWGFYSYARYQLTRRWYVGGRVDRSQDPTNADSELRALSTFVEFFPSEFQRFRMQYKASEPRYGPAGHELFFQWYYLIGTHGAHRF